MGSQILLLGRRTLVVGWLFVSFLLFIAGQWQLHQLHGQMRRQDNTLLRLKSVWHIAEKHEVLGSSRGESAPVQQTAVSSKQHGITIDSSSTELNSYHTAASGASGSSKKTKASSGGSQQGHPTTAKQQTNPSSDQHTVQAHPRLQLDDGSSEGSSSSSSADRKGGTFLQHLSDGAGQGKAATHQQQPKLPSGTSSSSTAAATTAAAGAASDSAAAKHNSGSTSSTSGSSTFVPKTDVSKSLLAPVLTATARAQEDPAYRKRLEEAASKPINIAVMTGLFWNLPTSHTQGCKVDGIPLDCHIQNGGTEEFLNKADALYYHVPSFGGKPRAKAFPHQLRIAMSLESAAYYPNLDNANFMCQFDAEMTYRTCAQVTNWYSLESYHKLFEKPPLPFEEKLHAIAYVNSNCGAQSGRAEIMRALIKLGDKAKVPVHALGRCDNNKPWPPGRLHKIDVMRKYKFCVAMENSIRQDYMTEKMWDALAAGCIPIYLGSKNAAKIIPDPNSIIMYDASGKSGHASSPEQLDAVMHEIGSDKQRYEAMLAWKTRKPEDQPSEIFRYLWTQRQTTGECFLCQFLARHRAEPQEQYTTCLFDKNWMDSAEQRFIPKEQTSCGAQQQPAKAATQ